MEMSLQLLPILLVWSIQIQSIYSIVNLFTSQQQNVYYINNEHVFTWYEALTKCARMNMSLVTINTKEKSDEITDLLKKSFSNVKPQWIGGVANGNDHHFVWISSGDMVTFSNWVPGKPKFSYKHDYCLLAGWNKDLQWIDFECQQFFGVICEHNENCGRKKEIEIKLPETIEIMAQRHNESDMNQGIVQVFQRNTSDKSHSNNDRGYKYRDIFIQFN